MHEPGDGDVLDRHQLADAVGESEFHDPDQQ